MRQREEINGEGNAFKGFWVRSEVVYAATTAAAAAAAATFAPVIAVGGVAHILTTVVAANCGAGATAHTTFVHHSGPTTGARTVGGSDAGS